MSIRLKSIFGHGVDISHIPRVVSVYDRQGIRFLKKMMHEKEISQFESLHSQDRIKASQFIASRWSLKEAIIKATGSRLLFPEMYLVRDTSPMSLDPRPSMIFEGKALKFMEENNLTVIPSISHDADFAIASVIVEQQTEISIKDICSKASDGI